jgi:hypothetical protein
VRCSVRDLTDCKKMNAGAAFVQLRESIKWQDAQDELMRRPTPDIDRGLRIARDCRHPDASLFPAGVSVTGEDMKRVMRAQGDDVRALFLRGDGAACARAAELGYAPAQAYRAWWALDAKSVELAQRAASQSHRVGLTALGCSLLGGEGCAKNPEQAMVLLRAAADLEHAFALFWCSYIARGKTSEKHFWFGRLDYRPLYAREVFELVPLFEKGEHCRLLQIAARMFRKVIRYTETGDPIVTHSLPKIRRVIQLHESMVERVITAIDCWSVVARRIGVVKDIRVVIGKIVWDEAWAWPRQESACAEAPPSKRAKE